MEDHDFPVSDYYAEHVLDGVNVSKKGAWWSAVVAIKDPDTEKKTVILYKWQKRAGEWKRIQNFKMNKKEDAKIAGETLLKFADKIFDE